MKKVVTRHQKMWALQKGIEEVFCSSFNEGSSKEKLKYKKISITIKIKEHKFLAQRMEFKLNENKDDGIYRPSCLLF